MADGTAAEARQTAVSLRKVEWPMVHGGVGDATKDRNPTLAASSNTISAAGQWRGGTRKAAEEKRKRGPR
jgi:hypothetical protein